MARSFIKASSEYAEVASAAVTAVPLTFSAWIKINTLGAGLAHTAIAISRASGAVRDSFVLDAIANAGGTTATVRALCGAAGSSAASTTTATFVAGVWVHVVAVYASNILRTSFLNGVAAVANTTSLTPSSLTRTAVGRLPNFNSAAINHMDGSIAEPAIWNTDLTADEIMGLYLGVPVLRVRRDSLKCYPPLLGASPEPDYSGNGLALTLTGSTVAAHAPVAPMFSFDGGWQGAFTAAAGGSVHVSYYYHLVGAA